MACLGAHMSIAGGYHHAVEAARRVGCDCVQLFTKNNNQWRGKPITDEDAELFRRALTELNIVEPLSHSSYLINLASPNQALLRQSIDAMIVELQRAGRLGIRHVVLHPGSYTTSSEAAGLATIAKALDECFRQTSDLQTVCLLENTAGQGSNLGWRFEHLAEIISRTAHPKRLAVCIDTCHTFAAGYPLGDSADYQQTIEELDRVVGIAQVRAIHLNDSKTPFGSRKDRHEHIGRGEMGLAPFWNLLNDPRWANIPMYLETEKGIENGRDLDEINLRMLRNLIGGPQPKPAKTTLPAPCKSAGTPPPKPKSATPRKPRSSASSIRTKPRQTRSAVKAPAKARAVRSANRRLTTKKPKRK